MKISDVQKVITYNLGYKKGEKILIVADAKQRKIGGLFYKAGISLGADAAEIIIEPRIESGEEPPKMVSKAMLFSDIIIMPTTKSLSHTKARRDACGKGGRVASMPGITIPMFERMMIVDYAKMERLSNRIAARFARTKIVRVTTTKGTDLTMDITGRKIDSDTGILIKKGDFGNLPAGEASLAPLEGTTEGKMIIDGSVLEKKIVEPIKVTIRKGFAVKFEGARQARELDAALKKAGKLAYNIAELGIGTNDKAILTGNILEDEKIYSTCHIAFGNNMSYGGTVEVPLHQDAVLLKPDIYCDSKIIMRKGKLII